MTIPRLAIGFFAGAYLIGLRCKDGATVMLCGWGIIISAFAL